MSAKLIPGIPIAAKKVPKVAALKDAVLLHHPVVLVAHVGLDDRRRYVRMIVRGEQVSDVVEQAANEIGIILAVDLSSIGGLQAMKQPVNSEPTSRCFNPPQLPEHLFSDACGEVLVISHDDLPVLGC